MVFTNPIQKEIYMANSHRGEVDLVLADQTLTLRLTLQGLAELESAFGVVDLTGLGMRFSQGNLGTNDIVKILGIVLRGGGFNKSDNEIANLIPASSLPKVIAAVAQVLALTFGVSQSPSNPT
jgi:Phage tail tube protein, GTA-gp10